jgi:hypothetical protein
MDDRRCFGFNAPYFIHRLDPWMTEHRRANSLPTNTYLAPSSIVIVVVVVVVVHVHLMAVSTSKRVFFVFKFA